MNVYPSEIVDTWMNYEELRYFNPTKFPHIIFPSTTNWKGTSEPVVDLARSTHTHDIEIIKDALRLCTLPYKNKLLKNLDIFITSFPSIEHVNACANGQGMTFFGRGTQIPKAMTHYVTIHELGHVFDYRFFCGGRGPEDDLSKYYTLRKWETEEVPRWVRNEKGEQVEDGTRVMWKSDTLLPWAEKIVERFAEDFRYLFGGRLAKQDYWGLPCAPPGNDIKELMLEVIRRKIT